MEKGISLDRVLKGIVTLALVAASLFVVWYFWRIILYVLISAVLAIVGRPLVRYLARVKVGGWQVPRWLAAAVTLVIMWVVAGGFCALFLPLVFDKLNSLATLDWNGVIASVEEPLQRLQNSMSSFFAVPEANIGDMIRQYILSNVDINFMRTFSSLFSVITTAGISIFSVSFITFYFLKEDGLFYKMVAVFFPERYRENLFHALDSAIALLSRYFGGLMVESLLLMTIISSAMMLWGMRFDNALIIGLIMGVMNLIPYAGPFIGGMVSAATGIIEPIGGDVGHTVLVIGLTIIVVKLVDDFIIQPTLYSERVQAHPLEVFLVILVGGYVGGMWGMLLGIPLYTIFRVFAREFFSEYALVRRITGQMRE